MTDLEFEYLERAMEALKGDCTEMTRVKILRTMSQITGTAAQKIEQDFVNRVEEALYFGA